MINHIFRLSFLLALLGMGAARKGSGGKRCNTASISLVLVFISACEVVLWSVPLAGAYPDSALERTCLQDYFQQQKDNFKEVLASTHSLHGADACRWDGEGGSSHGATSMNALCSSSHSAMLADVMRGESELMDREGNRLRLEQITLANRNPLLEKHYRPLAATKKVLQMAPAELVYHGGCPSGELGKEQRSTSVADLQRLPLASLASLPSLPLMAPPTLLKGDGQSSLLGATPSFLLSTVGILLLACAALLRSKSSTTFAFKPKSSTSTSFGTLFTIFMATSCIFCVAPPSAEAALTLNDFILMKECGLRCWLGGLNFTIPDQTLEKAGITLHITGMSCAKIELGALGSQFTPPATLRLDGSGIGISCVAKWSAKVIGIDNTGTVSVTIGDSKVGGSISFTKDSDGLAGSASLSGCTTNLNIKDIHFSGGLAAKLLELFHDLIARVVSSQLNQVICTEIGSLVSTNLTAVLQSLDAQIRPYLKPVPPSPPPPVPADSLVLTGDSVIELIDYIANDVIGANGAFGLNKLVNAYTNNTGYINITDIPAPLSSITIPLVFGTNITVGLTNVAVAGLNSWSQFEALVPTDKYSLFSHSLLEHLNMTFVFFVNVTTAADGKGPIHGDYTLFESGILVLDMEHNELNGTAQLALSEKALKGLFPQQILNNLEECVLASLYDVNVTQLQFGMSIHQLKLIAGGGDIEKDLDAAIDNALLLFTTAFGPAIPAFFSGVVALAGRNEANRLAAELLAANHTCPPPPVVPPPPQVPAGSLVLADDPVIALVDYILNKVIGLNGPFGLNSLVDVLSQGTGVFDMNNLPAPLSGMTFPIPGLGSSNVTVGLTDISVGGLDTWTKLEAVVPYGNYSLASQLLLENLTIELGFFLNVSLQFNNSVKASSLDETGRLVLSLNHTQLDNSIQLGLSESFLKSLQPQQLLDHPEDCIMASVSNVNITSLHLGTSAINMQVKRNNKNNNQLGQLVDALPYFNTTFNSMYSSFVMETLSWLGRQQLNQVVASFMADNFTCPSPLPPPPPPPVHSGSLPLPNNTVVNLLDTVVNEMIGANGPLGLNKVIDAITSGSGGLDIGKLLSGHLPQITIPLPGVAKVKMRKNRALPRKSTELIDSQEREQVLRRWVDLAMKERLRLGTLNGNRSWKPALQAVQKEAKIPECFVKGDKLNQFLEEAFKLAVEKYGHLNTTTVKIPSPRVNQKEEDDRGAEDQCNSVVDSPRREEGTSVVPKGKIDSDSVSADGVKERTSSQVALLFDCISSVSRECGKLSEAGVLSLTVIVRFRDLIESLDKEINNLMVGEEGSANSTKGGPALGSQRSYAEVVGSAPRCDTITAERNFSPTATTASAPSLEYWKEEMAKEQGICWQDNSNIYRRTWTKDTVTDPNYWATVKPKYGFASPYSKVGAVEGRSIVVSGKDLKKEKVCERILELGLKHVGVWKVGEKNGTQHWGVTLEKAQAAEDIIAERARLYAFTRWWVGKARIEEAKNEGKPLWKPKEQRKMEKRKEKEENIGTVALDSSLELSGVALAEEEYHGAANWSDIVEEEGEETQ